MSYGTKSWFFLYYFMHIPKHCMPLCHGLHYHTPGDDFILGSYLLYSDPIVVEQCERPANDRRTPVVVHVT